MRDGASKGAVPVIGSLELLRGTGSPFVTTGGRNPTATPAPIPMMARSPLRPDRAALILGSPQPRRGADKASEREMT